jgi:hypothetical protein
MLIEVGNYKLTKIGLLDGVRKVSILNFPWSLSYNNTIWIINQTGLNNNNHGIKLAQQGSFNGALRYSTIDTAPTVVLNASIGNVTIGTHVYATSFVTTEGSESIIGPISNVITTNASSGQVKVTPFQGPSGTSYRNIYRSLANTTTPLYLITSVSDNSIGTFVIDNIADNSTLTTSPTISNNYDFDYQIIGANIPPMSASDFVFAQFDIPEDTKKISFSSESLDAFARLRISNPVTVFDVQNQYNDSSIFAQTLITGGGSYSFLPNESTSQLTVSNVSGDKVTRQSREYFRYIPGKSQLIIMSRVLGAPKTNVRVRTGLFDDRNGLYFEVDGSTFGVVQRSFTSGSVVNTRFPQSAFNIDKLNGYGDSSININLNNANIFIIDYEWLGAGRVRYGIYGPNGRPVYCHEIDNANALTSAYMSTGNLPLRTEIENIGTVSSSTNIKSICSSVITEGGSDIAKGVKNSASMGVTTAAVTTRRPIISIRPRATFNGITNRAKIDDISYSIYSDTAAYYEIVYNGVISSPGYTPANTINSTVEFDVSANTITGGVTIESGYVAGTAGGASRSTVSGNLLNKLPITLDASGLNPINLAIVVNSFAGTSNMSATFNWTEIY